MTMYHYIKEEIGYDNFNVESGQYIGDSVIFEGSSISRTWNSVEQSILNDKIFELLGTITLSDETFQQGVIGFFGLESMLSITLINNPLIKCKKLSDDRWHIINIMVTPRRPKNGKCLYEISIYYITIRKLAQNQL